MIQIYNTIRESGRATADLHAEPSEPQIFTTWATTESSRKDKPSLPEIGLPRYAIKFYVFLFNIAILVNMSEKLVMHVVTMHD